MAHKTPEVPKIVLFDCIISIITYSMITYSFVDLPRDVISVFKGARQNMDQLPQILHIFPQILSTSVDFFASVPQVTNGGFKVSSAVK